MGTGKAKGEERAILAAQQAINSPLLQNKSIKGARGVLINITSSEDLGIHELNQASELIYKAAGYDSDGLSDQEHGEIIHGFTIDNTLDDEVRVTVIATGIENDTINKNSNAENRKYEIPDHRYNNPQTSININNKNTELDYDSSQSLSDQENKVIEKNSDIERMEDESLPVFGEDLDVPAYLRNNR